MIVLVQLADLPEYQGIRTIPLAYNAVPNKPEIEPRMDLIYSSFNPQGTGEPGFLFSESCLLGWETGKYIKANKLQYLYQFNSLELLITDDKPFGTIRFFCISCDFLTPKTGRALFNVMQKEFLK